MPNFDVTFEGPDGEIESVSVELEGLADDITDDQIEEAARNELFREVDDVDEWDIDLITRSD